MSASHQQSKVVDSSLEAAAPHDTDASMADALSLTFDDDDLLGPALGVLPMLPTPSAVVQPEVASNSAAGNVVTNAGALSTPLARKTNAPATSSTVADQLKPAFNGDADISDHLLSQVSLTGPAFEYSLQTSQQGQGQAGHTSTSAMKVGGRRRYHSGSSIPETLTQSPIKRSRGHSARPAGFEAPPPSAAAHPPRPPAPPNRQEIDGIKKPPTIPGPAGLIDAHSSAGSGVADISVTQQQAPGAPDTSAKPELPTIDGEEVVGEWFATGSWRQLCIDLDLPAAAAPAGLYPDQQRDATGRSAAACAVIPLGRFRRQAEDNARMCWKSVPGLAVVVTAFRATAAGGLAVVQDWTGCCRALIARDVLQDFGTAVAVGSCLALVGVSIVQPAPGRLYLNIRSNCVARVYPPDCPQPKLRSTQQQHSQQG